MMPRGLAQLGLLKDRFLVLPCLTTVLVGTIAAVFVLSTAFPALATTLALSSQGVLSGGVYRLVTYPLAHAGVLHVLFNVLALVPVLSSFEEETGTVATSWLLFVFTLVPGLGLCLLSIVTGGASAGAPTTYTMGASGWVFTLMAYFAMKDYAIRPALYLTNTVSVPTYLMPVLTLAICTVVFPGSSLVGHVLGLAMGYAYALNKLAPVKLSQRAVQSAETILGMYGATRVVPRFVSDEAAAKVRVVSIDSSVDSGVPSGSTSPVLAPFARGGRPLGN
ncbi:uncharacterized protein V1510DRAFT_383039 [Dipodascopsis tothii]|uniref:uncharacterized protein n=1 Tax=Dipodascopsis tothii TaxID=44089 RepID=UPI0034CEC1F6